MVENLGITVYIFTFLVQFPSANKEFFEFWMSVQTSVAAVSCFLMCQKQLHIEVIWFLLLYKRKIAVMRANGAEP